MPLVRKWMPSPNYSSRGGTKVRCIVLHTAEGALTYQSLGNFFGSSSSGVSSHTGIDDTPNTIGEYVSRGNKAWTQANANPFSVATELCAFAKWTASDWAKHPIMLQNCAAWIAEESKAFGIPIVRLTASQAQGGGTGVCQHVDFGAMGGGHWDCGTGFPMDQVLQMAKSGGTPPTPTPTPPPTLSNLGDTVFIKEKDGKVYWLIYNGSNSYWRQIPAGLVGNIPPENIIPDPNGSWLALWKVGA